MSGSLATDLDAFRAALGEWLDREEPLLERQRRFHSNELPEVLASQRELQVALFDAGWVRYGWPEEIGGLGGDARHRASVWEALGARLVPFPESYYTLETLVPMLSVYGPALAREHVDALLRGDEAWCQGFSEPDAGSDLASLRTKAVRDGDDWVISGHKIWTSQVSGARRCVALVRTGTPESRHRGLSMFLVDHDSPGFTWRPIRAMSGMDEFGEVHFDDVHVPGDRLLGEEGDGWGIAMYLLQWERGMYPWQRQTSLLGSLDRLVARDASSLDPGELADAYLAILPMRLSSRTTVRRLAAGESPGPETSIDKVLLSRAEVIVHDLADSALGGAIELADDHDARVWRHKYLFSRAAPIYGGSVEIQRTILADRVLGLPEELISLVLLDQDTLDLFARTVRGVLAADDAGDRTEALEASGWRDVLLLDASAAVPVVFRVQGELRARTAALDDVAIEAAGPDPVGRFDSLDGAGWVHAPARAVAARADDAQLVVEGLALRRLDGMCAFLADVEDGVRVASVAADALEQHRVEGMDPSLGLVRVRGSVPVRAVALGADASSGAVEAACRRALAFELTGLVATMLATTSDYAGVRTQFGQPIGAFQAVKHRLADVLVALRSAEVAASESFEADAADAEVAAVVAKCLAGRAARLASENCLQVMGAIGFTEEHELHRFIARATVLDALFGSAHQLRIELGRALLRRGSMPRQGQP